MHLTRKTTFAALFVLGTASILVTDASPMMAMKPKPRNSPPESALSTHSDVIEQSDADNDQDRTKDAQEIDNAEIEQLSLEPWTLDDNHFNGEAQEQRPPTETGFQEPISANNDFIIDFGDDSTNEVQQNSNNEEIEPAFVTGAIVEQKIDTDIDEAGPPKYGELEAQEQHPPTETGFQEPISANNDFIIDFGDYSINEVQQSLNDEEIGPAFATGAIIEQKSDTDIDEAGPPKYGELGPPPLYALYDHEKECNDENKGMHDENKGVHVENIYKEDDGLRNRMTEEELGDEEKMYNKALVERKQEYAGVAVFAVVTVVSTIMARSSSTSTEKDKYIYIGFAAIVRMTFFLEMLQ